jgi:hypothetical protein
MNEKILTLIIWIIPVSIFCISILRLGIEVSKHPLGNETKK